MSNTARLIYEGPNKILPKVSFELSKFRQLAIPMFFSQLAGHATGIIAALMTGNYFSQCWKNNTAVFLGKYSSDYFRNLGNESIFLGF